MIICIALLAFCVLPILPRAYTEYQFLLLFEKNDRSDHTYVANYDKLFVGNQELDMEAIVHENSNAGYFKKVLVIDRTRIWFVYVEYLQTSQNWCIASVNLDGRDFFVHHSDPFVLDPNSNSFEVNNECNNSYYEKQSGYYYDGKIILSDHVKLIEYDILTDQVREFKASEYVYPICPYDSYIANYDTISITSHGELRTITPHNAAQKCNEFDRLIQLKDQKTWNKTPVLSYLFDSVIYDGKDIFILCRVLNYGGETHLLVFRYWFNSDEIQYWFDYFNDDVINDGFYIVPQTDN